MKQILVIVFLLNTILVHSQSVKVSAQKDTNWKQYRTFTLAPGELVTVSKKEIDSAAVITAIRRAIISELESRGFQHIEAGTADLQVNYTGEVVETTNVQEIGPLGQTPADEPIEMEQSRTWSQDRRQGSLAIDISEVSSNKSLWRSSVSIDFSSEELPAIFNGVVVRSLRKLKVKK